MPGSHGRVAPLATPDRGGRRIASDDRRPHHGRVIVSLVTNLLALVGLLFLGWSVWMAVAVYWLENLLSLPAAAIRIRRAFPHLTEAELEAYLAGRESERSGGVTEASRLRAVIAERGLAGAAPYAARRFVTFYGAFALAHGGVVFVLGFISSTGFDWLALLLAALVILAAEALSLRLDRRPIMPDVGAYTGRMIVLHATIIFGGLALTLFGGTGLAVVFVGLKLLFDIGTAVRARRGEARTTAE